MLMKNQIKTKYLYIIFTMRNIGIYEMHHKIMSSIISAIAEDARHSGICVTSGLLVERKKLLDES